MATTRRRLLATLAGGGLVAAAGCAGDESPDGGASGSDSPAGDDPTTPVTTVQPVPIEYSVVRVVDIADDSKVVLSADVVAPDACSLSDVDRDRFRRAVVRTVLEEQGPARGVTVAVWPSRDRVGSEYLVWGWDYAPGGEWANAVDDQHAPTDSADEEDWGYTGTRCVAPSEFD